MNILDLAMQGARITDRKVGARASAALPGPHEQYVQFLKDTALSMGKKAVLEILVTRLPTFLTSRVVGSIFVPFVGYVVGMALEIAIRETEIGLFFLFIDMRTNAQGKSFEEAARKNLDKQRNGTPEERATAEKELVDAFRKFAKLSN